MLLNFSLSYYIIVLNSNIVVANLATKNEKRRFCGAFIFIDIPTQKEMTSQLRFLESHLSSSMVEIDTDIQHCLLIYPYQRQTHKLNVSMKNCTGCEKDISDSENDYRIFPKL